MKTKSKTEKISFLHTPDAPLALKHQRRKPRKQRRNAISATAQPRRNRENGGNNVFAPMKKNEVTR
jgi:hypothetical protein